MTEEDKKTEEKKSHKDEPKPVDAAVAEVKDVKKDTPPAQAGNKGAAQAVVKSVYGEKSKARKSLRRDRGKRDDKRDEFEQRILDIARVTRVMAGGKRMSFRACVAIGDKKGKVGVNLGKGADVTIAITKAVNKAKKNMITVSIVNNTIPHEIWQKFGAAKILFKPASKGRGVIAGGVVRIILELAGIHNVTSKILGTNNKVSNAKCTIEALKNLKRVEAKNNKAEDNKKGKEKNQKTSNNQ